MNGWLVLARCGMDDIPMRLFPDRKCAYDYASTVTEDDVRLMAVTVYDCDVSVFVLVCVVQIINGYPQTMDIVKDLSDGV